MGGGFGLMVSRRPRCLVCSDDKSTSQFVSCAAVPQTQAHVFVDHHIDIDPRCDTWNHRIDPCDLGHDGV